MSITYCIDQALGSSVSPEEERSLESQIWNNSYPSWIFVSSRFQNPRIYITGCLTFDISYSRILDLDLAIVVLSAREYRRFGLYEFDFARHGLTSQLRRLRIEFCERRDEHDSCPRERGKRPKVRGALYALVFFRCSTVIDCVKLERRIIKKKKKMKRPRRSRFLPVYIEIFT